MLLRVQLVDGCLGATRETQETGECDGEQRRQKPSHPAPPFTRDRTWVRTGEAFRTLRRDSGTCNDRVK